MQPLNVTHAGTLVVLVAALGIPFAGCIGGFSESNVPEGYRCNPYNSSNQCASGLACTVATWQVTMQGMVAYNGDTVPALGSGAGPVLLYCPENYCCPVDSNGNLTASSNPYCQPGCNGGAASICAATGDPDTCACAAVLEDGGSPNSTACTTTPPEDGAEAPAEAGTPVEASMPADGGDGGG